MKRYGPAFLVSILLHAGLLGLAYISWVTTPKVEPTSAVAVQVIADVPSYEMAEAPVDELAVKPPEPTPSVAEVPPPPEPVPTPKQPVPTPQKPAEKKQDKKPDAPKKAQATVDPKGQKKPQPDNSQSAADKMLAAAANPATSPTRRPARPSTQPTDGASARGNAPQDVGPALTNLGQKLARLWNPNCDVPGGSDVVIVFKVTISPNGRIIKGPTWTNRRSDSVWEAGFNRAAAAVSQGQALGFYKDLPEGAYNREIPFTFNASKACAM